MSDMWQKEALKTMMSFDGDFNEIPRMELYTTHHVKFPFISEKEGIVSQPVCQFLIGLPFDDLALSFISMFNPDKITVTTGMKTLVGYMGRKITVTVTDGNIILNVNLSAPVKLPPGDALNCGHDLTSQLEKSRKKYDLREIQRGEWF